MFDPLRWDAFTRRWFWLLMLGALILGVAWPSAPLLLFPYLTPLLALMLFTAFLKLDGDALALHLRRPGAALLFAVGKLLVLPALVALLTLPLRPDWRIALLLLAAMPQGVATPTLLDLLGGDVPRGFSWLLASYLLVPITVPLVMVFGAGAALPLDPAVLARDLGCLIFGPFLLARLLRSRWNPRTPRREACLSLLSVLAMLGLTSASAAKEAGLFRSDPAFVLRALAVLYLLYLVVGFGGWMLGRRAGRRAGVTGLICSVFFNNSLAVVLAGTHLSDEVLALVVLGAVPWDTLQGPVAWISRRLLHGDAPP